MSIDLTITHVLVDLTNPLLTSGVGHLLVRLEREDRENIKIAALAMGMHQEAFTRTVLVRAAEKVIRESIK